MTQSPDAWIAEIELLPPGGGPAEILYLADTPLRPFAHTDADRPNRGYSLRLVEPPAFGVTLSADLSRLAGGDGAGTLTLSNADGALSAYRGYAVGRVRLRRGREGTAWRDWAPLVDGRGGAPGWTLGAGRPGRLALPLADLRAALDVEILTDTYAGSGGSEGPAELAGRKKPLAIGDLRAANIAPVWLSQSPQLAQIGRGPMTALDEIRDRGGSMGLASDGDRSGAAFDGWSPAVGHFGTDLGRGLLKMAANPGGEVTLGLRGLSAAGMTWTSVAAWVLAQRGQTVGPELAALAAPASVGIWLDDGTTWRALLDLLCRSGGGWCVPDAQGVWRAGTYRRPTGAAVVDSFDERTVEDIDVDDRELSRPVAKVSVKWGRVYRTMTRSDLASGLWGTGREAELRDEWRTASREVAATRTRWGDAAREVEVETALVSQAAAETLRDRLLALLGERPDGSPPESLRVVVPIERALALSLGAEVHLTYGREGIDDPYIVHGIVPASPRRHLATLRVFR